MAGSESRRQLILAAMVRVVGRKGYKETSVADVIEEAGVSRTTFYKHFEDKHECFLAAYEMLVEQVFGEVDRQLRRRAALAGADARSGWRRSSSCFALDPELARTAVVEVAAAGADARQLHWDAIARFTEYLDDGARARRRPRAAGEHLADVGRRRLRA